VKTRSQLATEPFLPRVASCERVFTLLSPDFL